MMTNFRSVQRTAKPNRKLALLTPGENYLECTFLSANSVEPAGTNVSWKPPEIPTSLLHQIPAAPATVRFDQSTERRRLSRFPRCFCRSTPVSTARSAIPQRRQQKITRFQLCLECSPKQKRCPPEKSHSFHAMNPHHRGSLLPQFDAASRASGEFQNPPGFRAMHVNHSLRRPNPVVFRNARLTLIPSGLHFVLPFYP